MKVFRDLKIAGNPENLNDLVNDIDASLEDGWSRDHEREKELLRDMSALLKGARAYYCFTCDQRDNRDAASVYLFANGNHDTLEVTNIVPEEKSRLTPDEYNKILEDFHERFVQPKAARYGATVEFTPANEDITRWISTETARKLSSFSKCANKSTGSSHPMDQTRWYAFVVATHVEESKLDASYLRRWLHEEDGWGEDEASELAIEYESARSLLAYYDAHKV